MRITFDARNFDEGTRWVNPGHVLGALLMLALVCLIVLALI